MNFGRLHAPDERDTSYPMRALLQPQPLRTWRYWNDGGAGDQGDQPSCVGWAWWHWLRCGPTAQRKNISAAFDIYQSAQERDEWPGENYDGTSVRGGAKAVQAVGYVTEYRWAQTVEDVIEWLLYKGPVVVGTYWYSHMMQPDGDDVIRPLGAVVGGHAYCLTGVNLRTGMLRVLNSWGNKWGGDGRASLPLEYFESLLTRDGEACTAVEKVP